MAAAPPVVSVVIAVYNAEASIEKTLASALLQTYGHRELIVIDGGSTDKTWEIIGKFADSIAYQISENDRGIADAYNKGIRAAKGEWIYFLNADDVFADRDVLADIFSERVVDEAVTVIAGQVVSTDGRIFAGRFDWRLLIRNQVHHQAILYRARFLKSFPYNADYRSYGHDHEHNLFIWRRHENVLYVNTVVALWARGGISDQANWRQYREEFRVRRNVVGGFAYLFNVFSIIRFAGKRLRQL